MIGKAKLYSQEHNITRKVDTGRDFSRTFNPTKAPSDFYM